MAALRQHKQLATRVLGYGWLGITVAVKIARHLCVMGGGGKKKKKLDPEKEAAKQARKASKASKVAARRERRYGGVDDEEDEQDTDDDIDAVLRDMARQDLERTEVKLTHVPDVRSLTARSNCSLASVGRDEIWLFGGERCDGDVCQVYGELYRWRLDRGEWTKVDIPGGPCPRCSHQAVEVSSGKMLLFGGEYSTLTQFRHFNDLWCLDTKRLSWERRDTQGRKPSPRSGHRARQWRGQLLLFGGFFKATDTQRWFNDCWVYAPARNEWTELETSKIPGAVKPPPRSACVVAIDVKTDTLLVWGGYSETACNNDAPRSKEHIDSWALPLTKENPAWDRVSLKGPHPSTRAGANAVVRGDNCFVFGGVHDEDNAPSCFYNELYVLDLVQRRWHLLFSPGDLNMNAPAPRIGTAIAARDARTLVIIGGVLEVKGDRERTFDDFWLFDVNKKCWTCHLAPSDSVTAAVAGGEGSEEEDGEGSVEEDDEDNDELKEGEDSNEEVAANEVKEESKGKQGESSNGVSVFPGESLRDFYERTKVGWLAEAGVADASEKHRKRAAFELASRFFQDVQLAEAREKQF